MSQIGRRKPNVSVLLRTVVPKTYLIPQVGDATASGTITATRSDSGAVAGAATAAATVGVQSVFFADVAGTVTAGAEASAGQGQLANVAGVVTIIATSAFTREDLIAVNGAVTAHGVILAKFYQPDQRIRRFPQGRY